MKNLFLMVLVVVFLFGAHGFAASEACGETVTLNINTPHPLAKAEKDTMVWRETIHQVGAGWLKPHFSKFNLNDEDYILLYDMAGNIVERIEGSDVEDPVNSRFKVTRTDDKRVAFWGPMVDGNEITIEIYRGSDKRKGYGFEIDDVGVGYYPLDGEEPVDPIAIESICGTDDKTDIKCAATAYQTLGLSVGRMLYQIRRRWYVCTGFLVSSCSSHFLSNEHCITDQNAVDTLQVRFKYRYTTCGGSTLDSYATYYGDSYVTDSTTYDFCLMTLQGTPQNTYGYLDLLNRAPVLNEDIYIIQHPGGNPQQIGYGTVYSTTANSGKDLGYYVDTEGGSSGSPVFAENGDGVIGLHHFGGCPNSGVKMSLIYNYIISYICN
jgi:lysyl endopeptidase